MIRRLFSREVGGFSHRTDPVSHGWATPYPEEDMYLRRMECAESDYIDFRQYCEGLPIVCQFGRGRSSHLCAVTEEQGHVMLFDTRQRSMANRKPPVVWQAHNDAVFDYAWICDDQRCLTAGGDRTVVLWDVESKSKITTFCGHIGSVRTIAPCPDNPAICASGARDGHIVFWDTRVNRKDKNDGTTINTIGNSIQFAHALTPQANLTTYRRLHRPLGPLGVMDLQQSVTALLYHTENTLISAGANDGRVKFWDTRKWYTHSDHKLQTPVHTYEYPGNWNAACRKYPKAGGVRVKGIMTMCLNPWKSQLFVCFTDNRMFSYDIAGAYREPEQFLFHGLKQDTFYMRCAVSPGGKYLVSGSGANTGIIWETGKPEQRPVYLYGHTAVITATDWCPTDMCKVATLSDDQTLRIWRPDSREPHTEDPTIRGYAGSPNSHGVMEKREANVELLEDQIPYQPCLPITPPLAHGVKLTSENDPFRPYILEPCIEQSLKYRARIPLSPQNVSQDNFPAASTSQGHSKGQETPSGDRPCVGENGNDDKTSNKLPSILSSTHTLNRKFQFPDKFSSTPDENRAKLHRILRRFQDFLEQEDGTSRESSTDKTCSYERNPKKCLNFAQSPGKTAVSISPVTSPRKMDLNPGRSPRKTVFSLPESPRKTPRSPRKMGLSSGRSPGRNTLTPVKSPRKLLSPSKYPNSQPSSHSKSSILLSSYTGSRRQLFSSPTANLPNSILEPPRKTITPPPTPKVKKIDWLTQHRLAKLKTSGATTEKGNPVANANPDSSSEESLASSEKEGGSSNTPKRQRKVNEKEQAKNEPPQKKNKVGQTSTPGLCAKGRSFSKSTTRIMTRSRRSSVESPKTLSSPSIRRYLKKQT